MTRAFINRILPYINKLNTREKTILIIGLIGATGIILYGVLIAPLYERYTNLNRLINQKESQYKEILQLKGEYLTLKDEYKGMEKAASKTKEGFSPLTFMEGVSAQAKIKDKVVSMKPTVVPIGENYRESSIEVKIEKVVLEQIMRYLHMIEGSDFPLKIKILQLKNRFDDAGLMDASVVVSFYEKIK